MYSFDGGTGAPNADTRGSVDNERYEIAVFTIEDEMVFVGADREFAAEESDDFYHTDGTGFISYITSESGEKVWFNVLGFELDLSDEERQNLEDIAQFEDDILPDTALETADWFDLAPALDADASSSLQLAHETSIQQEDAIPEQFQVQDNGLPVTDFQFV